MRPSSAERLGAIACADALRVEVTKAMCKSEATTTDGALANMLYDAILNVDRLGARLRGVYGNLLAGMPGEPDREALARAWGLLPRSGVAESMQSVFGPFANLTNAQATAEARDLRGVPFGAPRHGKTEAAGAAVDAAVAAGVAVAKVEPSTKPLKLSTGRGPTMNSLGIISQCKSDVATHVLTAATFLDAHGDTHHDPRPWKAFCEIADRIAAAARLRLVEANARAGIGPCTPRLLRHDPICTNPPHPMDLKKATATCAT